MRVKGFHFLIELFLIGPNHASLSCSLVSKNRTLGMGSENGLNS